MPLLATCLGHPRIGLKRELKFALESYWQKKTSQHELEGTARALMRRHWQAMQRAGIQHIPSNDFSLYDHVLDAAVMLGFVPARYRAIADPLARYFAMARGLQDREKGVDIPALEMTKWFDTNYHYIVPELETTAIAQLDASKILRELEDAQALGIKARPVLLGPVSFLLLSKLADSAQHNDGTLGLLETVLEAYSGLLTLLREEGVELVQLDEPCLVLELSPRQRQAYQEAFAQLANLTSRPRLFLATYFGALAENLPLATDSGFEALHIDLVRAPEQLDSVLASLPARMSLSLGLIDGRNVWRTELDRALATVKRAVERLGADRVWVAPSCSLLHVPVDLEAEHTLDPELRDWLAFAAQKLGELRTLADLPALDDPRLVAARNAAERRGGSARTLRNEVRERVAACTPAMLSRSSPYAQRARKQVGVLPNAILPTTTVGSFPQTGDVRAMRASWRSGRISDAEYQSFLRRETQRCIERQEQLGIDVLVHGEFERSDMVEYFGEQLDGFVFTQNGWVQSYGSRCVKPPILYGDVARPKPMTVEWARYAQSLTKLPVKGMLTLASMIAAAKNIRAELSAKRG